ncbi:MAG: M48 family metallopeptidase [Wenzhouxiangellaceae bacterium]
MRVFPLPIRLLAITLALLLCLPLPAAAEDGRIQLPDLGATAGNVIPIAVERAYARTLIHRMREAGILVEDPQITAFFADMGYNLASHSDEPDRPYYFVVLDEPHLNAFAAPGGVIALHSGLILEASEESEVAGVLSHEIAHITQQHTARALEQARQVSIPLMLAMLGLILASGGSGEVAQAAVIGSQAASIQSQINFTRQNEYEADRIGIATLAAAGYRPQGMAGFFEKMSRIYRGLANRVPEYLRTHPVTTSRIAEAKNRASLLPASDFIESIDFHLMQARLRALTADKPEAAIAHFRDALDRNEGLFAEAHEYGMSLALLRAGKPQESRQIISRLLAASPEKLAYQIQQAETDMEAGDKEKAFRRFSRLHYQFPGNTVVTMHYSQALLSTGEQDDAVLAEEMLKQHLVSIGDQPQVYELYARAADKAGNTVRASEAMAESFYLRGEIGGAIYQLEQLSKRDDLDYYQRARISSRLSEMKVELAQYLRSQG